MKKPFLLSLSTFIIIFSITAQDVVEIPKSNNNKQFFIGGSYSKIKADDLNLGILDMGFTTKGNYFSFGFITKVSMAYFDTNIYESNPMSVFPRVVFCTAGASLGAYLTDNFHIYMNGSMLVTTTGKGSGSMFDFGMKYYHPVTSKVNLFAKGEYSVITLSEARDSDKSINLLNIGFGVSIKY